MSVQDLDRSGRSYRPSVPSIQSSQRSALFEALVSAGLTLLPTIARALPKRRHKSRGSPELPRWLREDIGLLPDSESSKYWDHQ